jgi:hypothetical protein
MLCMVEQGQRWRCSSLFVLVCVVMTNSVRRGSPTVKGVFVCSLASDSISVRKAGIEWSKEGIV